MTSSASATAGQRAPAPIVVAHRGASGYLPEETLEAYAKAIELGADVVEFDLISTKDGVLITRHDPNLALSTDVADHPEFAARKRTTTVDGEAQTRWFAADFTLAEIKMLGAVATDPETKNPTYHRELGLPLEDRVVEQLTAAGWTGEDAPVYLQSFEPSSLKLMRDKGLRVRMIQLVDAGDVDLATGELLLTPPYERPFDWVRAGDPRTFRDMLTPAGLAEIATYAEGIGPWKRYLITVKGEVDAAGKVQDLDGDGDVDDADATSQPPSTVVADAHRAGLLVHPYTFRDEARRLARDYREDPVAEYLAFYRLGVDGVFTDFTDTAREARTVYLAAAPAS